MKRWSLGLLALAYGWLCGPLCPSAQAAEPSADALLARARQLAPAVRWLPQTLQHADFDCDGTPDWLLLGKGQDELLAALLPGRPKAKPLLWRQTWRDVAIADPQPSLEPLDLPDRDFLNMLGYVPEGYRRSSSCQGISISDGETDALHLYWNHQRGLLGMWSL